VVLEAHHEEKSNLPQGFIDELSSLLNTSGESVRTLSLSLVSDLHYKPLTYPPLGLALYHIQRFVIERAERENHSKDASYHAQGMPDGVAFPKTAEEVQVWPCACVRVTLA
jgi:hypothetical protein